MESATVAKSFEGWAIVDVLGHQRHAGYVTSEYYGATVLFRVQTPAREQRERVTADHEWPKGWGMIPLGARVTESARPGSERLIGAGSIYMLTPTREVEVLGLLDDLDPREVIAAVDAEGKTIEKPKPIDDLPF